MQVKSLTKVFVQFQKLKVGVLFLCIPWHLFGEGQVFDVGQKKYRMVFLPAYTQVYEDKNQDATIEIVSSPEFQSQFKTVKSSREAFNFSYSKSAFWFRIPLQNSTLSSKEVAFVIAYPRLSEVDFYSPDGSGYDNTHSGYTIPFLERTYRSRFFVFPTLLKKQFSGVFYIRIESPNAINVPLQLWEKKEYDSHEIDDHVIQSLYFGIVIAMVLFNLILYFILRDINYLLYVSIVLSTALAIAANNGIAFEFFWGNSPNVEKYILNLLVSSVLVLFLLFMRRMLSTQTLFPRVDKISILLICIQIFLSILFIYSFESVVKVFVFSHTLTALWILLIGVLSAIKKQRTAYFFVLAFAVLFLALIISTLRALGLLPTNSITLDGPQFGSALEMILLAFALADRYSAIRKAKEAAEELVKSNLERSNLELEQKVKERTFALNESLTALRRDLVVAKKIQESALSFNPKIFEKLTIHAKYIPMSEVGGDFFDVFKLRDTKYRILLADATGHGVQAAMITMATKALYDNVKNFDLPPGEILSIFNDDYMRNYVSLNSLLTAIVVDIDFDASQISYASAGHPPAVLFQNANQTLLSKTGKMIGIQKGINYRTESIKFGLGDRLFIFTDGIFEEFNLNEEEYGEDQLYTLLQENLNKNLDDTIEKIFISLDRFLEGSERQDDITILGLEFKS